MSAQTKVAVSGVTGFVGAQVALDLLRRGYTVHGTLRRNTPERIAHLTTPSTTGTLRAFEADLTEPSSFDAAVEGCTYAIHVASPYAMEVADPQRELVDPAVNGTLNFLRSCKKAGIKKVVLTSSLAAISDGGEHGKVFTEADWNTHSSLKVLPYYYSKAQAEKAAWKFIEEDAPEIKLVVINPVVIFGPSIVKSKNESASIIISMTDGLFYGVVDLKFPTVDVRDVSEAHIRAMESDTASGRYICMAETLFSLRTMSELAREMGFKPPMTDLTSKFLTSTIKLVSYVSPGGNAGHYTRRHLGNPIVASNEKIIKDLDMKFRDAGETFKDTIQNLVEFGHLKAPSAPAASS